MAGIARVAIDSMTVIQDIERLRVTHWPKTTSTDTCPSAATTVLNHSLVIDTCLRRVAVTVDPDDTGDTGVPALDAGQPEFRSGVEAYQLLLEIATGLRSSIPGETNVFGQWRKAWQEFRAVGDADAINGLAPVAQQLFNDTRSIRRRWLDGTGGASYGSLVRRLISARRNERVLFVGTGELMHSIVPLFSRFRVGAWNHRSIESELKGVERLFDPADGECAARWSNHIILTTPPNRLNDSNWQRWINASQPQSVTQLGHRRGHEFSIDVACRTFNLDDVFEARRLQHEHRTAQLTSARLECIQRARLLGTDCQSSEPAVLTGQLVAA